MPRGSGWESRQRTDDGQWAPLIRQPLTCEGCGKIFLRHSNGSGYRDAMRFCSRLCCFLLRQRLAAESAMERSLARSVRRAVAEIVTKQRREEWEREHHCSRCGTVVKNRKSPWCRACVNARQQVRRGRDPKLYDHICPMCGGTFTGTVGRVCCSSRCLAPYQKRTKTGERRYPRIRTFPVEERNRLAHLLYLTRAAYQRIDAAHKAGYVSQRNDRDPSLRHST